MRAAGITCLFASSHCNPDEHTAKYVQGQQAAGTSDSSDQPASEVQNTAIAVADAAVHAEVPAGPSIELAENTPKDAAELSASGTQQPVADSLSGDTYTFFAHSFSIGKHTVHAMCCLDRCSPITSGIQAPQ